MVGIGKGGVNWGGELLGKGSRFASYANGSEAPVPLEGVSNSGLGLGFFAIDVRLLAWDHPSCAGCILDTEPSTSTNYDLHLGLELPES